MTIPARESTPRDEHRLPAVRIRLGEDRSTPQPDPLGRARVGYRSDLSTRELWDRGRGVWRAKAARLSEAALVLLTHDDVVRLVGTIEGVRFIADGDRVAIEGQPLPRHPLIGKPDPLHNDSRNSVAYGDVLTTPPDPSEHGSRDAVLAAATRALTEAARAGGDWAEVVTLALAGAAANIGGVELALSGRSGSWEADGVRSLLYSTVGEDESELWRYRTEPVRISIADALYNLDEQQESAEDAAAQAIDAARAPFYEQISGHCWTYKRSGVTFACDDPTAPAWNEAREQWRADQHAAGTSPETIEALLGEFLSAVEVPKSEESRAEVRQLEEAAEAAAAPLQRALDTLLRHHRGQRNAYIDSLTQTITDHAADRHPRLPILIAETAPRDLTRDDPLAEHLLKYGIERTTVPPLPGSASR